MSSKNLVDEGITNERKNSKSAIELFLERGLENVSTRDLTKHLGLSPSHIYHYFKDWRTLNLDAVTRFLNNELDEFRSQIESLSPEDKLKAFVDGIITDKPDPARKLYSSLWLLSAHDETYNHLMQTYLAKWQQLLAEIIRSGVNKGVFRSGNAERTARQLDAMLSGYSEYLSNTVSETAIKIARDDVEEFLRTNIFLDK